MVELFSGDHIIHRLMSPAISEVSDNRPVEKIQSLSKPRLSIKKEDYGVVIKFIENESCEVMLFSKRASDENFTLLNIVTGPEYIDTRPNLFHAPELREYMAYYMKDDEQIGQPSDITLIIKK